MLKIRLQPTGKRKQRMYRLVVQESTKSRDGPAIAFLGHYNPQEKPPKVKIDLEAVDEWMKKGAKMSETTHSLVKRARSGKWDDLDKRKKVSKHKKKKPEEGEEKPPEKKPKQEKKEDKKKKPEKKPKAKK